MSNEDDNKKGRPRAPTAEDQMKSFAPSVSTKNFQYIATKGKGKGSQGLFSLRRPRDASSGISSGFKNIGKGIGAGLGALVAAPVAGYREGGAGGLLGGVIGGVIGASVLIGTGITTGVAQMGRGIANTPSANCETIKAHNARLTVTIPATMYQVRVFCAFE